MVLPTLVRPEPSFDKAAEIQRFWAEHYDEYLERYPERYVAVKAGGVVASHPDLAMLVYELRDLGLNARTDVAIEFISAGSASHLL